MVWSRKNSAHANLLLFSLPFSPQTAVAHKEYQKAYFLLDVQEERRK